MVDVRVARASDSHADERAPDPGPIEPSPGLQDLVRANERPLCAQPERHHTHELIPPVDLGDASRHAQGVVARPESDRIANERAHAGCIARCDRSDELSGPGFEALPIRRDPPGGVVHPRRQHKEDDRGDERECLFLALEPHDEHHEPRQSQKAHGHHG